MHYEPQAGDIVNPPAFFIYGEAIVAKMPARIVDIDGGQALVKFSNKEPKPLGGFPDWMGGSQYWVPLGSLTLYTGEWA